MEMLPYQHNYGKFRDPDRYMRINESKLLLFDGARRRLHQMGIDRESSGSCRIIWE